MKIKVYLSTDGKHTVEADEITDMEDLLKAQGFYDVIVAKYGTKQEQAVKAYAKKEGFPDDSGNMAHKMVPGIPVCPIHKKMMTLGKWGYYCKTPDETQPKGWCTYKPPTKRLVYL